MKRDLTCASARGRNTVHVAASATGAGRTARASWRLALVTACALLGMLLLTASASAFTQTGTFDGSASPDGSMVPNRAAVDETSGDIYVLDPPHDAVDRFDHNGTYLGQLTGAMTTNGTLTLGARDDDVAVDNSGTATQGNVYVVGDNAGGPGTIAAFDSHGRFLWQADSGFDYPRDLCGVAVDSSGNLWIADQYAAGSSGAVHQLSAADGTQIGSSVASGIGECHIAFDPSGDLFATRWSGEIDEYTPPLSDTISSTPDANGNMDVETDSTNGDLYADHGNSLTGGTEVAVYDSTGTPLGSSPFGGANNGLAVDGSHRMVYLSDGANGDVQMWTMDTGSSKPFATTGDATSIRDTSATLNATVDPAGSATTDCHFDYGTTTSYGSSAPCATDPGSGTSDVAVTAALSSLTASTTYHYRIVTTNGAGTTTGEDNTFDTPTPLPPVTLRIVVVGDGTVTDPGTINCTSLGGSGCSASFNQGDTDPLTATAPDGWRFAGWVVSGAGSTTCTGTTSPCDVTMGSTDVTATATFVQQWRLSVQKSGSGSGTVTSSPGPIDCGATCSALFDDGTRVTLSARPDGNSTFVGWSSGGCSGTGDCQVTLSADTAVTATFAQKAPDATTGVASGVSQTAATVAGSVNPNGNATTCHFDYGTSTSYGSVAQCAPAPGSGSGAVSVSASLSGLAAGTTYHYRLVATNGGGTTAGADATFTTSSPPPPGRGTLTLVSHKATMKPASAPKTASVKVRCSGGPCTGKVTFKATIKVKVKKGHKTVVKKKTITVGSVSFNFAADSSGTLSIKLTSAAKSALKSGPLSAKASGDLRGSVSMPKTKVKKKKKKH